MRVLELRHDEVHVVGHAPQDGVGHGFGAVATLVLVAPEFLYPFQVDDRHHPHAQVGVLGDVVLRRDHGAMQAFVKQHIGVCCNVFPRGEGAWLLLVGGSLLGVVQVLAGPPLAALAVAAKEVFNLAKEVVFCAEVAEVLVTLQLGLGGAALHFQAVVAVKAVALDDGGFDAFASKNVGKGAGDGAGARPGRSGDGDDGMTFRHGKALVLKISPETSCVR